MKKSVLFILLAAFYFTGCNAQKAENNPEQNTQPINEELAKNLEPKGTWKVNKEVDEHGNIVKYDSIYTYSSHDKSGLQSSEVFKQYQSVISEHFPDIFNDSNENDSDNEEASTEDNVFEHGFMNNAMMKNMPEDMKAMIQQMEAMQQQFMQDYNNKQLLIAPENDMPKKESE